MQSSQIMKRRQIRKWKRMTKASTTTLLPCLPDEITFFHILPKVPAKCLIRLNCVSKLWYNTIHDPKFIDIYLSHGKSHPSSLVALLRTQDAFLHYLHLEEEAEGAAAGASLGLRLVSHFPIIGHCNGLTCNRSPSAIQISNPTTREVLTFPQPSLSPLTKRRCHIFVDGFGFDPVMNEYKVIKICLDYNGYYDIWVYTLGTDSWRNITATCNYPPSAYPATRILLPICTTEALYWMNTEYGNILSFDLHLEKFQLVPCPKVYPAPGLTWCGLYELGGHPSLVFRRHDNLIKDGIQLIIYILTNHRHLGRVMHTKQQQQGRSWIRVTNCNRLPFKTDTKIVQIIAASKERLCLQWNNKGGDFIRYSVNKKKIFQKKLPGAQQIVLVNHVENLLSLKTFVPVPSAGDFKVKYVSSRKAKHESSTAASTPLVINFVNNRKRSAEEVSLLVGFQLFSRLIFVFFMLFLVRVSHNV